MALLRVSALGLALALFVYCINQEQWYVASLASFLLAAILFIGLLRYVDKTNYEFSSFLESIKHKDLSKTFEASGKKGKSFKVLQKAYEEVIKSFQEVSLEKESHYQFLQTVVEHVNTALICFNADGNIVLINDAAHRLFATNNLKHLDEIELFDNDLYMFIKNKTLGKAKLIKLIINGELFQLSVNKEDFILKNESLKLISLKNIKKELEYHELGSWKKLIRVLTHEIMNSVTSITSLSSMMNVLLNKGDSINDKFKLLSAIDKEDIINSTLSIERRSKGLLDFVKKYKSLTKIPKPNFGQINVAELINSVQLLLKKQIEEKNIIFIKNTNINLSITADKAMIEQVLLNLTLNSIEALDNKDKKQIEISSFQNEEDNICISIKDNGGGIDDDILENIFIPFYTTKKEGSGIGLSISRQIMQLHGGEISAKSLDGKTVFMLKFK